MSVQESLAHVRSSRADNAHTDRTHAYILDAYEDAIREHEAQLQGHREALERHTKKRRRRDRDEEGVERKERERERGGRFRFKSKSSASSGDGGEGKRKRGERADRGHERESQRGHGKGHRSGEDEERRASEDDRVDRYAAHPLPRPEEEVWLDPSLDETGEATHPGQTQARQESDTQKEHDKRSSCRTKSKHTHDRPLAPDKDGPDPDAAFASSLFDALADDEGAAYWEGVYSQPINVYPRPKTHHASPGSAQDEAYPLEEMTDEEYVQYVKRKMWERANPHLVREMEMRAEREREGKQRRRAGEGGVGDVDAALARGEERRARGEKDKRERERWEGVWERYVRAWKVEGLGKNGARDLPWPSEGGRMEDVDRESVARFLEKVVRYVLPEPGKGEADAKLKVAMLKAERFRWHPDKVQHRFGGADVLGEEVMEKVTGVFQVIDEMLEQERKRLAA
ncbi:Hypothetical protein D9617_13g100390 [Elsinoe fawcettii]|nr:Hypothetical protein D9617_13g100390 [Elsinoe fawcettii]